jgi:TM2 domain-containing membrane protein YozV
VPRNEIEPDDDYEDDDRPARRGGGGGGEDNKKVVAGVLALLLGGFGVHKFYLGYTTAGIIQIVVTLFTCGFGAVIPLIEGIIYLTKSDRDFYDTYQAGQKAWF